jgi:cob(I)alamin adenosyltransferase
MNEQLAPLTSFILPAGGGGAAALHLGRSIVRRAERSMVAAGGEMALNPQAMAYINRLSDHLFVLARLVNHGRGGDVLWRPGSTR